MHLEINQYRHCTLIIGVIVAFWVLATPASQARAEQNDLTPPIIQEVGQEHNMQNDKPARLLYGPDINKLDGWNHTQNFSNEFIGLKQQPENYQTDAQSNVDTTRYATTLVKKLGDWEHQHGNGIIADIHEQPLHYAQISGLVMLLKINSKQTYLPTLEQLLAAYADKTNEAELLTLDEPNVYLSIALFGAQSRVDKSTFNADYLLKLDSQTQLDKWLSVFIPVSALSPFIEKDYQEQIMTQTEAQEQPITGLRIMAETASTKVIRNLIPTQFNPMTPKLFKEIALEIKYLAITVH
tara:strand:+ start:1154 stop:2041 length:888 start_codon:yes stop_codon:yes gene_type:complete